MLDFGALPPEINSGRMYSGPGAGPLLAAALAWDELAAELNVAASGYGSVVSELSGGPWLGAASMSMAAAAAPYVSWLGATAGLAEQTASQARAAVAAYEAAFAMTVPPPVIAANRALLMALVATNFFGQNTPAIMATEALYAEMWAQDAVAMYGYAGASATASTVTPFSEPAQSTNPGGVAGQSAAVAQATATPAGTSAQTTTSVAPQLVSASAVPQAVQQVSSSTGTATSSTTSSPSWLSWLPAPIGTGPPLTTANYTALLKQTIGFSYMGLGMTSFFASIGQQLTFGTGTTAGAGGAWFPTPQFAGLGLGGLGAAPVSAGIGQAASVGSLSVPSSWASAAGGISPAAQGAVSLSAVRAAEGSGNPSGLLRGVPLSGMGRRAAGGFVHRYGFRYPVIPRPPAAG